MSIVCDNVAAPPPPPPRFNVVGCCWLTGFVVNEYNVLSIWIVWGDGCGAGGCCIWSCDGCCCCDEFKLTESNIGPFGVCICINCGVELLFTVVVVDDDNDVGGNGCCPIICGLIIRLPGACCCWWCPVCRNAVNPWLAWLTIGVVLVFWFNRIWFKDVAWVIFDDLFVFIIDDDWGIVNWFNWSLLLLLLFRLFAAVVNAFGLTKNVCPANEPVPADGLIANNCWFCNKNCGCCVNCVGPPVFVCKILLFDKKNVPFGPAISCGWWFWWIPPLTPPPPPIINWVAFGFVDVVKGFVVPPTVGVWMNFMFCELFKFWFWFCWWFVFEFFVELGFGNICLLEPLEFFVIMAADVVGVNTVDVCCCCCWTLIVWIWFDVAIVCIGADGACAINCGPCDVWIICNNCGPVVWCCWCVNEGLANTNCCWLFDPFVASCKPPGNINGWGSTVIGGLGPNWNCGEETNVDGCLIDWTFDVAFVWVKCDPAKIKPCKPPPPPTPVVASEVIGIRPVVELRNVGVAATNVFDAILVAIFEEPRIPEIDDIDVGVVDGVKFVICWFFIDFDDEFEFDLVATAVDFLALTGLFVVGVVVVVVAAILDAINWLLLFATRICDANVFGIVIIGLIIPLLLLLFGTIIGCVVVAATIDDNDGADNWSIVVAVLKTESFLFWLIIIDEEEVVDSDGGGGWTIDGALIMVAFDATAAAEAEETTTTFDVEVVDNEFEFVCCCAVLLLLLLFSKNDCNNWGSLMTSRRHRPPSSISVVEHLMSN